MREPASTDIVPLSEIAEQWLAVRRGSNSLPRASGLPEHVVTRWRAGRDQFAGIDPADMDRWVTRGYDGPDALDMPSANGEMTVPMIEFDEDEGNLIVERALSGEDCILARWDPMPAPRGLSVRAAMGINCGSHAGDITDYTNWLLSVIDGIERLGESPSVSLTIDVEALFQSDARTVRRVIEIPVQKAGERTDVTAWRALLAPGGLRTLGFTAIGIVAKRHKARVNRTLGRPTANSHRDWRVDLTDSTLDIEPPGSLGRVDKDALTERVTKLIEGIK